MRKWNTIMKKMAVLLLSAVLISAMMPVQLRAQEQSVQDETEIGAQSGEGAGTGVQSRDGAGSGAQSGDDAGIVMRSRSDAEADSAVDDDMTGGEKAVQTMKVQDTGAETKDSDNADNVESDGNSQDVIGKDVKTDQTDQTDKTDQSEDDQYDGQQDEDPLEDESQTGDGQEGENPGGRPGITLDPIAFPILMDSSNELYGSLSQFLSLSSDQFQIYTVAVIDPMTQQPVQPDSPVEVSLDVPSGYDADRVVVSEISMDGEIPVRTELSFTYNSGKAVFETDHSGVYVVIEKKVQPQLPASLEMTSKVEKLELTKKYPDGVSQISPAGSLTSSARALTLNPQTGDDHSVLIWGVVTAIAAAAVIVLIVIIIKRRK